MSAGSRPPAAGSPPPPCGAVGEIRPGDVFRDTATGWLAIIVLVYETRPGVVLVRYRGKLWDVFAADLVKMFEPA